MIPSPKTAESPDRYEEFLELFARDRERLYAYIYSLLPHHADAEDVFQRCSLLLWRKFDQFERDGSFIAWACGVAFYEVRNFIRTANRDRLQFDQDLVAQLAEARLKSLEQNEDRLAALKGCLENLSRQERDLVGWAYHSGRTIKDLAESSGQALQTLYNQLSRARRKLFDCMRHKVPAQG